MKHLKEVLEDQNGLNNYEDALSMNAVIMSFLLVLLFKTLSHLSQRIYECYSECRIGLERAPPPN